MLNYQRVTFSVKIFWTLSFPTRRLEDKKVDLTPFSKAIDQSSNPSNLQSIAAEHLISHLQEILNPFHGWNFLHLRRGRHLGHGRFLRVPVGSFGLEGLTAQLFTGQHQQTQGTWQKTSAGPQAGPFTAGQASEKMTNNGCYGSYGKSPCLMYRRVAAMDGWGKHHR